MMVINYMTSIFYMTIRGVESGKARWAATPQYEKWEGEHMFSPPPPIIVLKYIIILNFNPTSCPIFKWINELYL